MTTQKLDLDYQHSLQTGESNTSDVMMQQPVWVNE